ncbi:MAG: hypothetical protein ABIJ20_01340 [Nanoarchaeota archaeon]|nr:hypothetical protein [Nanoarchaeota archaeon]MBU1445323.1 hypothetical protein [Nanoarchaeota archaeon]MBU2420528.1 hypothetical protein [Nanoarchaeota archaeon]MBU2475114.1 hypothetical protein [Nanoarchaeota archaeon]
MNKRGQVTIFVILGIVILFLIFLVTVFKDTLLESKFGTQTNDDLVSTQVESIREHVEGCIEEQGYEVISALGKQGGSLNPGLSKYWYGDDISYLCYTEQYGPCYNMVPFLTSHMEDEITDYVSENLINCVNFSSWEARGYEVSAGSYRVETTIGDENVIILVDYPITISRGDSVLEENRFSKNFDVPLGKLARVADMIVNKEINNQLGQVFTIPIITIFHGEIEIKRDTHGPYDEVYTLGLRDDIFSMAGEKYIFQFAVRGWVT